MYKVEVYTVYNNAGDVIAYNISLLRGRFIEREWDYDSRFFGKARATVKAKRLVSKYVCGYYLFDGNLMVE